jgi:hypothetical protein
MKQQMNATQAIGLLKQLQGMYGDELSIRITMGLKDQKVGDVIPRLKQQGYRAHPEASSYAEREIVITSKSEDRPDGYP